MSIRLHIERLVLEGTGLSASDTGRLQTAIAVELTNLITNGIGSVTGINGRPGGGGRDHVRGGDIHLTAGATPGQAGERIARSLYKGVFK